MMNKRTAAPAPVAVLAFSQPYETHFSRFVVQPTPYGRLVVMDTLFGLQVGKAHSTTQATERAAQSWLAYAAYRREVA